MTYNSSILGFVAGLLRHRRWLIITPLVVGALSVANAYLRREYIAESRFVPQKSGPDVSRLGGLAAQLGLMVGGTDGAESGEFYGTLLESRDLLVQAAETRYAFRPAGETDSVTGTLIDLLEIKGRTTEDVRRAAISNLQARISVGTDTRAGTVILRVVMPTRELAEQVNRRLLVLVNEFNVARRQTQAAAEKGFSEQRSAEALEALEAAETDLRRFAERNRVQDDPSVRLQASRLQRRVDLRQQVYTELVQSFEQARLASIRNIPVVQVVDGPELSSEPSVGLAFSAAIGLLLGFFLAVAGILVAEYFARQRVERPEEYENVSRMARQSLPYGVLTKMKRTGSVKP